VNSLEAIQKAISLAANDHPDAKEYLELIAAIARRIDDLHDADHGEVDVGLLAHLCLVALPSNQFFARYAARLIPLHDLVINAWQDTNEPEVGVTKVSCAEWDYIWADLVNEIACSVAGITGGYAYRRKVSQEIRRLLYDASSETKETLKVNPT
jgi:hypothetical protein